MSQKIKGNPAGRDPPPSLFLHPSPAANHGSHPGVSSAAGDSSNMSNSALRSNNNTHLTPHDAATMTSPTESRRINPPVSAAATGVPRPLNLPFPAQMPHRESSRATDRTDALWAEMQATLEEVELSASGGTRVFGPEHDRKLAGLRAAQIALAQAWARSEADDAIETMDSGAGGLGEVRNLKAATDGTAAGTDTAAGKNGDGAAGTDGARSTAGGSGVRPGSSGGQERLGAKLEEETEVDILLARKRREANDRYFERVNQGVLDVVAKLEEVATAMRAVEQESKDIWGDVEGESVPSSARP